MIEEDYVKLELKAEAKSTDEELKDVDTVMSYDGSVEDLMYVMCILVWDMLDELDISAKTFAAMLLDGKRPEEQVVIDEGAIEDAMNSLKGDEQDDE